MQIGLLVRIRQYVDRIGTVASEEQTWLMLRRNITCNYNERRNNTADASCCTLTPFGVHT